MSVQTVAEVLDEWLDSRLASDAKAWFQQRLQQVEAGKMQDLAFGFGLASRKIPRIGLELQPEEISQADQVHPGWRAAHWGLIDAVRVRLVLAWPAETTEQFVSVLEKLFAAGEVHELIALYQGLAVYPFPEAHVLRAGEGIRTNMGAVFQAVSQNNVYPSQYLPEGMWNQMILKCLFVGISLNPVVGLDQRNNAALTRMLADYAHERWAAKRDVAHDLWRCVDPSYDDSVLADLQRVLETGSLIEQKAAVLTLNASKHPAARELLKSHAELEEGVQSGKITWDSLG